MPDAERMERFEASLRLYDHELRLAHRDPVGYTVERMIRNMPPDRRAGIAAFYRRTLGRPHKPLMAPEEAAKQDRFRRETLAKLMALQDGRNVILYLPDISDSTLQLTLGTLKGCDGWEYGGHRGNAAETAAAYSEKQDYQESFDAMRRDFKMRRDMRDIAKEIVAEGRWLEGATVAVGG